MPEVFKSTVENEDYVMGEMQQKAAESGLLKEIIFGRNGLHFILSL